MKLIPTLYSDKIQSAVLSVISVPNISLDVCFTNLIKNMITCSRFIRKMYQFILNVVILTDFNTLNGFILLILSRKT